MTRRIMVLCEEECLDEITRALTRPGVQFRLLVQTTPVAESDRAPRHGALHSLILSELQQVQPGSLDSVEITRRLEPFYTGSSVPVGLLGLWQAGLVERTRVGHRYVYTLPMKSSNGDSL